MKLLKVSILFICLDLLTSGVQAQFLDFSEPAQATALGGNLVALPEGPSALAFNPAGLAFQERFEASARYQSLFSDFTSSDNLSTSNVTAMSPAEIFGSVGFSWDHLGANNIAQDRFRAAWGKNLPLGGFLKDAAFGFSLSYLSERYTLNSALQGVSLNQIAPSSFAFGGGMLLSFAPGLTFGFSADDINNPNLGVVGVDRQPAILRWGLAAEMLKRNPIQLTLTASQSLSDSDYETQGGVELFFPKYGVRLRGGVGPYQGAVGFGFEWSDITLDYAYSFSTFQSAQLSGTTFPGSNLVELAFKWGSSPADVTYAQNLKRAQQAEATGNWDKATWWYQECLAAKPGDPEATQSHKRTLFEYNKQRAAAYSKTGKAAEKKGLVFDARNDYEMAVKLAPYNPEYSGDLVRIVAGYPPTSQDDIEIADAVQRGSEYFIQGNKAAAQKVVSDAIKRYPHQPALELLEKTINPPVPSAAPVTNQAVQVLQNEADLYISKGRPDLAKQNLEEALKAQPQNQDVKKKLERLEAPTPTVPPADEELARDLYEKGLKSYLEGDLDAAIKDWEDALKADPNHIKAQNNLIRAKMEKESLGQ